jgi:feruloyl-CoA synthase
MNAHDRFPPPGAAVERRADGSVILRSTLAMGPAPRSVPHLLDAQATRTPKRPFIRQREPGHGPWRTLTYGEAAAASDRFAQWLIDRGLREGDAVAILSGASIEHVIVALGAQKAGVIAAPISTNYSLLSRTHDKLRACMAATGARLAFAGESEAFAAAIRSLAGDGISFITAGDAPAGVTSIALEAILATPAGEPVRARMHAIADRTIGRIVFTSGSTGTPKACAQTQSALMSAVAQIEALGFLAFAEGGVPQILEAMPFSHIMAGSYNFNNALRAGATINLDEGKPIPGLFETTIANLKEVSPSYFVTAPLGLAMLADALELDPELRRSFFRDLSYIVFGGAMLPQSVRRRLVEMGRAETGRPIPLITNYGSTETGPATSAYWDTPRTDIIGLPTPGTELKLIPLHGKLELRVRGPSVMPRDGYFGNPALSAAAFDEEGFYRTGDAVKFADPDDPAAGLEFDGRLGEQLKLMSGTWVSTGTVRTELLTAADPLLREAVICCEGREAIGALAWLNEPAVRAHFPAPGPARYAALREKIEAYNRVHPGLSQRIERLLLLSAPLSFDANEVTDKNSVNPGAVRTRRAADIERLFAEPARGEVMLFGK